MKEFYRALGRLTKIECTNKNSIKMDLFLSFLTVTTQRSVSHLGATNGWTLLQGDNDLLVKGGMIGSVEYLHNIQYGKKLDNPYNNYVNPFYLFEIFTEEGKKYFLEYYSSAIEEVLSDAVRAVKEAKDHKKKIFNLWNHLRSKL